MCSQCGRPQFANQATCVSCGAVLPEAPATKEELKSARDRLLEAHQPFLEANLGRGQRISLSEKQLEWHGAPAATSFALPDIQRAALFARPVWEALLIGLLAIVGLAVMPWLWLKVVFGGFLVLSLAACFAQKRFFPRLMTKKGEAVLPLGIGAKNAASSQRIQSIWASLRSELERQGVPCDG